MTIDSDLSWRSPTWRSSFQPDCRRDDLNELRAAFYATRARIALEAIEECERINRAAQVASVGDELLALLARPSEAGFAVFDDPVFAIWLRFLHRALANGQAEEVRRHAANLPAVLERVEKRLTGGERRYIPGSGIPVHQDDLDPYIQAAAPPTYDFTSERPKDAVVQGHPIAMQVDLLGIALERIGRAWPELRAQVREHVKVIGYLPDATFRSCSAARYSGVVYFGNLDESVLDLEESIVHEAGHQVLYRLGEVTPLTRPTASLEATYVLPWSGSQRDLFGFFHAFYIYVLLAKYYWRRAGLDQHDADDCRRRAMLISLGNIMARAALEADPDLTDQARTVVRELGADMDRLQQSMRVTART